jgi:diadenosine tetraphosphatase ApaH/serine/threonine PP2A family protein phosphatase
MRVLILSDIHSNLTAFEAVLSDAGHFEKTICLGDVVGYGPDPEECVRLLIGLPNLVCIMGNHDAAVLNVISTGHFNPEARKALHQQKNLMTNEALEFLASLPEKLTFGDLTLAHGSPRDPIWEYVDKGRIAWEVFEYFETQGTLVGHTHTPCIFIESEDFKMRLLKPKSGDRWIPKERFILNPGSVGQPRDHDPRASYVIWDTEENSFLFKRVHYNISEVANRIQQRGIPSLQAKRLSLGR